MKEMGAGWTEERTETLKKLWMEGFSVSQIAKELGGVTRNAVIGKVHRLKLDGRPLGQKKSPRGPRPTQRRIVVAPRARKATSLAVSPDPLADVPPDPPKVIRDEDIEPIALVDLTSRSCRWPIGDPRDADFGFCGQPIIDGKTINEEPYCARHKRRAG